MIENLITIYRNLSRIPELKNFKFKNPISSDGICKLEANWSIRNLANSERINLQTSYFLPQNQEVQLLSSVINDKRIILSSTSPCGLYSASIFQDDDICYLTITSQDQQTSTINLKELDIHEKIYNDIELSSFCWSPDSSMLAYVAEKKKPKATTFFVKPTEKADEGRGSKFTFIDDWGEQMTGQHQSSIVVVNVADLLVRVLNIPEGLCGGQVVWTPSGDAIIGVAYITDPYRLGLIYCRNRESFLFQLKMDEEYVEITPRGLHCHSPRFSTDASQLAFIRSPMGGPHVRSSQLCLLDWQNKQISVLIDFVVRPVKIECGSMFSGLCGASILPLRCWSQDSKKLVFSAMNFFGYSSYIVDIETNKIREVPVSGNVVAHDVNENAILLSKSTCTEPSQLILMPFPNCPSNINANSMVPISPLIAIEDIPTTWQDSWTFLNSKAHPNEEFSDLPIPVIYLGPTKPIDGLSKRPLIVWVHGGPHSLYPNTFAVSTAFFVRLGYSIIFPNFRGSLGQGKDSLESLPGYCGQTDVEDVYEATKEALSKYENILDSSKVALVGGSHGGFLVAHLAAKYPEMYKVVSSRNPVIDIASMTSVTDIPDWNFVEAGVDYEIGMNLNEVTLTKMFKMSPINLIDQVTAPTLLLLGKNDRRVPYSQGLMYHKLLLARKVPTKLFVYEDTHPLSKVDVEADTAIQTAIWFQEHLGN